jgi:uncharacterized protein
VRHVASILIVMVLLVTGCGTTSSPGLKVVDATLARGLSEQMEPVNPTSSFAPSDTVCLSIKLQGNPKRGVVTVSYFYKDEEITRTSLDLEQELKQRGALIVLGGNTLVGFTLQADAPFPPGDEYRAKLFLDGAETATYTFSVVDAQVAADPASPTPTLQVVPTTATRPQLGAITHAVDVTALWYSTDITGKPIGGTSQVKISVEPNVSGQFRVGFFEGEVAGSGPMWRAAGWTATTMAALLTGFDPAKTQVSFDVGGRIDGPSAGGLMTIGVLAALRGDEIREDAAMTGTINPDGTIGPVGGILQKIEGAAEAGKTFVLIPIGRTERGVDLVEHGHRLGVQVREVSDVFMAYEALTGNSLPRHEPSERPQLSGVVYDRLNAKSKEWLARYEEQLGQYNSLMDEVKLYILDDYVDYATYAAERSVSLAAQGLVTGAYSKAVLAAAFVTMSAQTGRILEIYDTQGVEGAINQLRATQAFDAKAAAIADRLKAEQPKTVAAAGALISAYGGLIEALGISNMAETALGQITSSSTEEELLIAIIEASLYRRMADLSLETAKDILDMTTGLAGAPLPSDAPIDSVAEFFRRASEANLTLFDTVVLGPLADRAGMNLDVARMRFAANDFVYGQTRSSLLVMPRVLDHYFGGGEASAYAQLGGALTAYIGSTALIAKYYSLEAELDDDLDIIGFGKERVLIDTLEFAEKRARESVAFLQANDVDAAMHIVDYEAARLAREGDKWEKLDALSGFWSVYVRAQALAYLGGFAGQ